VYPLSVRNVEDLLAERGIDISHEAAGLGDALGDRDAPIEKAPDLADDRRAVIDHALSSSMKRLDVLLFDRFARNERDVRLARRRADRLSIVPVVLLPPRASAACPAENDQVIGIGHDGVVTSSAA
jgi:hypothetical protein